MHRMRVALHLLLAAVVALFTTVLFIVIATAWTLAEAQRQLALLPAVDGGGGIGSVSGGVNEQIAAAILLSVWAVGSYGALLWVASTEVAETRRWWRLFLWFAALSIAVAISAEATMWWFMPRSFHGETPGVVMDEANLGVLVTVWRAGNLAFIVLGIGQLAAAVVAVVQGMRSAVPSAE